MQPEPRFNPYDIVLEWEGSLSLTTRFSHRSKVSRFQVNRSGRFLLLLK
jgi:hypothetical protein